MDTTSAETIAKLTNILDAYHEFLESIELVFNYDWEVTEENIKSGYMIFNTFLEPDISDESDNWANRGSLLSAYRNLRALIGPPDDPSI